MELLIKRDKNQLSKTEGKSFVDGDVPNYLHVPRVVLPDQINELSYRNDKDDLLINNEEDFRDTKEHLTSTEKPILKNLFSYISRKDFCPNLVPGLWSGYRSTILQDPSTNKWFRLKGVALNPYDPKISVLDDGSFKIQGGQKKQNAEYERIMSNKFNRVLESEGIEPVMKVRGIWKYSTLVKGTRPAASIVEIKGDTRFDELIQVAEGLMSRKLYIGRETSNGVNIGTMTSEGQRFRESLGRLYHDIGFVVGRLKKLMDKNNQTWSSDYEQSNAHVGNIVVYNGTDKLKVGLVDFDISCDRYDFSLSQLKALQKREWETIRGSMMGGAISPRQIRGLPFAGKRLVDPEVRNKFVEGFDRGYDSRSRTYTNEIDLGELQEVFELLRQSGEFSFAPRVSRKIEYPLRDYSIEDNFYNKKISLDKIINNQYNYQKSYNLGGLLDDDPYGFSRKKKSKYSLDDYCSDRYFN